jgi:A/G-specific adenine glycosylase
VRRAPEQTFAARLLRWFDGARRDLPWRRTRDPWAIWVSEVMLQQTRVEAVRQPWERFLLRFPTPAAFAAASDDELLLAWRGLGYYRRARLLREGARAVAERHAGRVPEDPAALAELPGIGDYTLGAVASIAFGAPLPAIDGNVDRVVSRHRNLEHVVGTTASRRAIRAALAHDLDASRPGDFNQALMELGATVCTETSPKCTACPVAGDCAALTAGTVATLPRRKARRAPVDVEARMALAVRSGMALGYRIAAGEPNHGQIELPGPGVLASCAAEDLAPALARRFGAVVAIGPEVGRARHTITHHRITAHAHLAEVADPGALSWFPIAADTPWTTPSRKLFGAALGDDASGARPDA